MLKDIGIQVYSRNELELKKAFDIDKDAFQYSDTELSLVDMQYDRNYFKLFVLDENKGILVFELGL